MKSYLLQSLYLGALITLLTFSISCSNCPLQGGTDEIVNKSFTVEEDGILWLDSDLGTIEITTHSQKTIGVKVVMKARTSNQNKANKLFADFKLDFDQSGNDLRIKGDYSGSKGFLSWAHNNRLNVRFIITIPEKYNLQLKTSGGSISVSDLIGELNAKTSGGSLEFGYIQGKVEGRTSGGSIHLKGCSSDVNLNTSGGGIQAQDISGSIEAHTSGGSISTTIIEQPRSDCKLTTSGGSIHLALNTDIRANLDASTSGGRVNCQFPVTLEGNMSRTSIKAKINGGGPKLFLKTSGGNIHINKIN